ncbi:hypothetical protein Pyn_25695 [Prunus yedoensis var. nudiflora]|uniref:Uncharacterized protein n=1 Tax=Prunus yedoensis var. nudiflora TaxID=2094558 RepID=A0A314YVN5_PRUYE|nr:hypothetical protein Pyn_25695 [Prunus yedoensis var. nudiflora]
MDASSCAGKRAVFEGCGIEKFGRFYEPREELVLPKLVKGWSVEKSWFIRGHPYTLSSDPPGCPYSHNIHGSHVHIPSRAPFIHKTITQFWDHLDQPKLPTGELRIICLHPILTALVNMNPTKEKTPAGQKKPPLGRQEMPFFSMDDGSCGD